MAHAFGHASHDAHDEPTSLVAERLEVLEPRVDFLFGVFAHGTGVDKDGIGFVLSLTEFVAGHLHDAGNDFAVGHIHLAAVCFNKKFLHFILKMDTFFCKKQ